MYGSKIDNLIKLKKASINVPHFEVIKWKNRDLLLDESKYKGKYAIRSSANLEDGTLDSFAGQFDTFLNVTPKNLNKKIKECFDSINKENVKKYIEEKKISVDDIKMNVMIQEMVQSDYSGVLFTANPQGILNESVIVVSTGLGDKIVSDQKDATTYYYNLNDNLYYFEGDNDYLTNDLVKELIETSKKIKEVLGDYLDIEFAIKNNIIYILQARNITTLKTDNPLILDNSNIVESYPGISLPLTISFVEFVYGGVFKAVSYRILKNKKILDKYSYSFNNMVGNANGRMYYKISNWYTIIKFLPFNKKIIPIWQDMLGVKNKSYDTNKVELPFFTKVRTYFNSFKELVTVSKKMDKLNEKFIQVNNEFKTSIKDKMTNEEVKELFIKTKEELLDIWDITLVNDMYSFIFTGLLKKRLKKKKMDESLINEYISGISNIESLKPIKSLINISYLKDEMTDKEYQKAIDDYIDLYGDRNLEELKLESQTFRTNPKLLEDKIDQYRVDMNKLSHMYKQINEEKKVTYREDIITKFISKKALKGIKNREISRLNRARIYGMVRTMFLKIGENLYNDKKIKDINDIFYLTQDEIFNNNIDKKVINNRKKEYQMYQKLPTFSRLIFENQEFNKCHKSINAHEFKIDKNVLKGIPTSNGKVKGYALVIDDINKKYDFKDKILITKMTDPGWVFLIAEAKGIVSEKGSILSHTAIISRELNIPSIVGIKDATNYIKTGDLISMDSNSGEVKIIKRG